MDPSAFPLDTPALKPPPGVVPNFSSQGIKGEIQAVLATCLGVTTIFVWTRLYTRYFIVKSHGWEDHTSFIAWAGFIGYVALGLVGNTYGSGVHQWDVRVRDFITFAKVANALEIYYNPLIFVTKLSILLQYKKIFVPTNRGATYWSIHLLIWINLSFYTAVMLVQIMSCLPREKIWNPSIPGHCVDLPTVLIAGAVINILSDISILVLPIRAILLLQMSRRHRLGVCIIFASGTFACVTSILRMVYNVKFLHTDDVTFDLTPVALWTMGEISSGIVCGCLPVLPRFFRHYVPKVRGILSIRSRTVKRISTSNTSRKGGFLEPDPHSIDPIQSNGSYMELNEHGLPANDLAINGGRLKPADGFGTKLTIQGRSHDLER